MMMFGKSNWIFNVKLLLQQLLSDSILNCKQ